MHRGAPPDDGDGKDALLLFDAEMNDGDSGQDDTRSTRNDNTEATDVAERVMLRAAMVIAMVGVYLDPRREEDLELEDGRTVLIGDGGKSAAKWRDE